jgi:hypothetical protein
MFETTNLNDSTLQVKGQDHLISIVNFYYYCEFGKVLPLDLSGVARRNVA